jgi:hypothetical protein
MFAIKVVFDLGENQVIDYDIAEHDDSRAIANLDRYSVAFHKIRVLRLFARAIAQLEVVARAVARNLAEEKTSTIPIVKIDLEGRRTSQEPRTPDTPANV